MANFLYKLGVYLRESWNVLLRHFLLMFTHAFWPSMFDKLIEMGSTKSGLNISKLKKDDYAKTMVRWSTMIHELNVLWVEFSNGRTAFKGEPAPDVPVVMMPEDGKTDTKIDYGEIQLLKTFARPGVPLVINFGSCT